MSIDHQTSYGGNTKILAILRIAKIFVKMCEPLSPCASYVYCKCAKMYVFCECLRGMKYNILTMKL